MELQLKDLPQKCSELVESLELILVAETLDGFKYFINEYDDFWRIFIESIKCPLEIPKNISEYYPAFIQINKLKLTSNVVDLIKFEQEIKDNKILISKHEPKRGLGYVTMSGTQPRQVAPHWKFLFPKQNSLYDFYLISKKYGVF